MVSVNVVLQCLCLGVRFYSHFLCDSLSSICGSHMLYVASLFLFCSICLVDYRCLVFFLVSWFFCIRAHV